MRILMTTDTVGGVWSFTSELTEQLLQRGHAVHLVSFGREPSAEQVELLDRRRAVFPGLFGYTASDIPLEWMQDNERACSEGAALLETLLQGPVKPDLVLANQFCFGRLNTSVPRVVVAHSDVLSWARACKPSALKPTPWLNRYTSAVQAGLLDAAAVVVPTAWMGKALVNNFFLPRNYFVLPNGASVEEAGADEEPARKVQAITAGRLWDEGKGLDSLLDLHTPPMPVLVAGENTFGGDQTAASWPAHLTRLGQLSRTDLHHHFRQSALYLCTSRYEPFGLAPLEAALSGCAIVARDLPSLREIWGDHALYFTDSASLRGTLQALADDPPLLSEAQRRARRRAAQFTPERMAESYLHLFQALLSQPASMSHVA